MLNGWKAISGYAIVEILNFFHLGDQPLLVDAVNEAIENPSDWVRWANVAGNLLLLAGLIHKGVKQVKYGGKLKE